MAIQMQIRRGTESAWATSNPTLLAGELGFVTDAGKTAFKIGNNADAWTALPYVNSTYPELEVDGSNDLNLSVTQGRYPMLGTITTYSSSPALPTDFVQGVAADGNSVLVVTVPSNSIVVQELTTSLTGKRWIRAKNSGTWTSWQRLYGVIASDSLTIVNLTTTGTITIPVGLPATPSLTFTGDTNTGIYSSGGDNLSITTNGVQRVAVGNALTTIATSLTVTGAVTATVSGAADALIVTGTGVSKLKSTVVDGLVQISPGGANKFSVGNIRSGTFGLTEIYGNSSPYLKVMPTTAAAATDLIWTGTNAAGSPTTTIQCNGVPTSATDLTTKSYVDTAIAGSTAFMPKPQTAAGVGQIVSLADIYTGGGGAATVTVGASGQTWAYVGFFYPASGASSQNKVGVVTAATAVSGPGSTNGMVWVAAIRIA